MSLILIGNFMSSKSNSSANILPIFVIRAGCKYLTIYHFNYSVSFIFCILIKYFPGWSNSFDNLM